MCLIIAADPDKPLVITKEQLEDVFKKNDDGYGFMWTRHGRVRTVRGFGNLDGLLKMYESVKRIPGVVFHARMATHGSVCLDNTHPFKVTRDLALMHNGVINKIDIKYPHLSDTWHLANVVMPDLIERSGGKLDFIFENKQWRKDMEQWLGCSNKVVLMHSDGRRIILNEDTGHMKEPEDGKPKQWYSNKYAASFLSPPSTYKWKPFDPFAKWETDWETPSYPSFRHAGYTWPQRGDSKVTKYVPPADEIARGVWTTTLGDCHLCKDSAWTKCKKCGLAACRHCMLEEECFDCLANEEEVEKDVLGVTCPTTPVMLGVLYSGGDDDAT